jgi:hypothetical protein
MTWSKKITSTLQRWSAELSPHCRAAIRLQSEALERRLPWRQQVGLKIHLFLCKWCRRYGRQISFLRTSAHDHGEALTEAAPSNLSAEARHRIKQKLQSEK